jgi:hypothetical protein
VIVVYPFSPFSGSNEIGKFITETLASIDVDGFSVGFGRAGFY